MKAFFCKECNDMRVLSKTNARTCQCGKSTGYYQADTNDAVIVGPAVPIWIDDSTFAMAVYGMGRKFLAHSVDTTTNPDENIPRPNRGKFIQINTDSPDFSNDFERRMRN